MLTADRAPTGAGCSMRAHALAQGGALVPLIRGVYAGAQDDIEATILDHAIRIAAYLYPTRRQR